MSSSTMSILLLLKQPLTAAAALGSKSLAVVADVAKSADIARLVDDDD